MIRRPPRSTRTYARLPFPTLFRSQRGLSPRAAIHEAALLRFRPILMTTLAALFDAIPLMLATGAGSELRQPLGLVMVGGLLCSQVRSEEHTSELQSLMRSSYAVFCLKKKINKYQ